MRLHCLVRIVYLKIACAVGQVSVLVLRWISENGAECLFINNCCLYLPLEVIFEVIYITLFPSVKGKDRRDERANYFFSLSPIIP